MLTRITDRKTTCVNNHVYRITKNWGPGPYNSLRHADNRRYFFGSLSNAKSKGSAHDLLSEKSGKIWTCSCWEKVNFIIINEFKYGQTWKIWQSPLSLSLYSTFKRYSYPNRYLDLIPRFGRPVRQLCMIANHVMNFIYERWHHLLTILTNLGCLQQIWRDTPIIFTKMELH